MDTIKEKTASPAKTLREQHDIQDLAVFKDARLAARPTERLENVRQRALQFRELMLSGEEATHLKTVSMVLAPYPTKFAYLHAVKSFIPYIALGNKMFIVQFKTRNGLKNLLFGINDPIGNSETPFFKNFRSRFGIINKKFVEPQLRKATDNTASLLAKHGLSPEDIDYITFDHLHVQELRKWLGYDNNPGYFPNAKLLVMRQEWESAHGLLPIQKPWYCPDGVKNIDPQKVILLDSSVMLGQGVALVQSPGHTEGNHSLVVHIDGQLFVSSENGMAADSYAPLNSRIPGLKRYAEKNNVEVILNGNTLESSIDQYISMVMEKTIAGPHREFHGFTNVVPSSEHAPLWYTAPINPTVNVSNISLGTLLKKT